MSDMDESDRAYNRLACLKLAQSAEGENPSAAQRVLDRAEEYADFVSGQDSAEVEAREVARESWFAREYAELRREATEDEPVFFDFGAALDYLKDGARVARSGWNGKDMWIGIQIPNESIPMGLPYLYIRTVQGYLVPWLASQTDLLAEDWYVV